MKYILKIAIPAILLALLTAGCYTQFYRPGMEQQAGGPYDQLYNRYDSSAIDTTLTKPDYQAYDEYPQDNWGWWGQPRRRTLWGFDFYNFSPDYYWSYYGYYDYYGTPWWHSWNDPWYRGGWGGYGQPVPQEPPSRRPGDRGRSGGDGGTYSAPPTAPAGGSYVAPQTPPTTEPPKQPSTENPNKRPGGRGR